MVRLPRPRLKLRFSLKAFLVVCLVSGIAVGWISRTLREYQEEQHLIDRITQSRPPSTVLSIATNGNFQSFGQILM